MRGRRIAHRRKWHPRVKAAYIDTTGLRFPCIGPSQDRAWVWASDRWRPAASAQDSDTRVRWRALLAAVDVPESRIAAGHRPWKIEPRARAMARPLLVFGRIRGY